jgi:hypothetical protein
VTPSTSTLQTGSGNVKLDAKIITAQGRERTRLVSVWFIGGVLLLLTVAYIVGFFMKLEGTSAILNIISIIVGLMAGKALGSHGEQ